MPRFLDSPIWYTETGNQTRGVVSVSTSALNLTPEIQEGGLNVSLIIPPRLAKCDYRMEFWGGN